MRLRYSAQKRVTCFQVHISSPDHDINTPFQSHKMEVKEKMTSVKQTGSMPYSNTPFQGHKMEVKEKVTSVKQRGRALYIITPSKDYTRKDNFETAGIHYTNYKYGAEEL